MRKLEKKPGGSSLVRSTADESHTATQLSPGKHTLTEQLGPSQRQTPGNLAAGSGVQPASTTATTSSQQNAPDFTELDAAYREAFIAENEVMNKRAIGIREVPGVLTETDPPSLTDELMKSLIVAALGLASGGISAAIARKLLGETMSVSGQALTNAIQTALDDGLKDATVKVAEYLTKDSGDSKASFFAAQEEGLESLRTSSLTAISTKWKEATQAIKAAAPDRQAEMLSARTADAKNHAQAALATASTGRQIQFQQSLSKWMNALSQHKLGKHDNGTNLQKAVDMCPMDHFKKKGVAGVIYVPLGSRPAARPLTTSGQGLKVAGMTEAARDRVKSTPIKDLDMPIVASGYIYDGTWDALSVSMGDNEIAFGKNENDQVWVNGHGDAFDGLKKAAGRTDATVAARLILEEDIGTLTLAKARVE